MSRKHAPQRYTPELTRLLDATAGAESCGRCEGKIEGHEKRATIAQVFPTGKLTGCAMCPDCAKGFVLWFEAGLIW